MVIHTTTDTSTPRSFNLRTTYLPRNPLPPVTTLAPAVTQVQVSRANQCPQTQICAFRCLPPSTNLRAGPTINLCDHSTMPSREQRVPGVPCSPSDHPSSLGPRRKSRVRLGDPLSARRPSYPCVSVLTPGWPGRSVAVTEIRTAVPSPGAKRPASAIGRGLGCRPVGLRDSDLHRRHACPAEGVEGRSAPSAGWAQCHQVKAGVEPCPSPGHP